VPESRAIRVIPAHRRLASSQSNAKNIVKPARGARKAPAEISWRCAPQGPRQLAAAFLDGRGPPSPQPSVHTTILPAAEWTRYWCHPSF